jgi:beta-galactosidase
MVLIFVVILASVFGATIPPEIEDLSVIDQNKLAARTAIWPSPTLESAQTSNYENNDWLITLNGVWKFSWAADPQSRKDTFYEPNFDTSGFDDITVHSTTERQGYGTALYTNINYPFSTSSPPKVFFFFFCCLCFISSGYKCTIFVIYFL